MKQIALSIIFISITFISNAGVTICQDGLEYFINNGKASVLSISSDECFGESCSIEIPEEICYNNVYYPVVEIGESAFEGCKQLRRINLSKIEKIGKNAFKGSGLLGVAFTNTVTTIEECAFADCVDLRSLYFSSSINEVGERVFESCNLKMFTLACSLKELPCIIGKSEEVLEFKSFLNEVICLEKLNGTIFCADWATSEEILNIPEISLDMIPIVTKNIGDNDKINFGLPVFLFPPVSRLLDGDYLRLDFLPNAFWPGYVILVDRGTNINIAYPGLSLCYAPAVEVEMDYPSIPLQFNGINLMKNPSGIVESYYNSPTYDFILFDRLQLCIFYETPIVEEPSVLTLGVNKVNAINEISIENIYVQYQWYDSFGNRITRCKINELPEDLNHGVYIGISESGESIKIMR